jgi:hypothetical protein
VAKILNSYFYEDNSYNVAHKKMGFGTLQDHGHSLKKAKSVPLHAMEALGGE